MNLVINTSKAVYDSFQGLLITVVGRVKTGKTTLLSVISKLKSKGCLAIITDPRGTDYVNGLDYLYCFYINPPAKNGVIIPPLERGFKYLNGPNKGKPMPVYSLAEAVDEILDNWETLPYDTIAIDTINSTYNMFEERAFNHFKRRAEKEGKDYDAMGDYGYGSDWAMARNDTIKGFIRQIVDYNACAITPKNVVVTCQLKEIMDIDNPKSKIELPSVVAGVATWLMENSDVVFQTFINKQGMHYLMVKAFGTKTKATRLRPLVNKKIPFFPVGEGPTAYESIMKIFDEYNKNKESEEFNITEQDEQDNN